MEIVVILIGLLILAVTLNINLNKIKRITNDDSLDYITKKLPNNGEICEKILSFLGRNIEIEEDINSKQSLYIVITDKIILGKTKIDSVRVQTIAHECIHSIQNRIILLSNYFLSNIFNVYFIIALIFTVFGIFQSVYLHLYILTILAVVCVVIRNYLETDAMTRAESLAEKYLNTTELEVKEQKNLINYYKKINSVGIPLVNFMNTAKEFLKPILYILFSNVFI